MSNKQNKSKIFVVFLVIMVVFIIAVGLFFTWVIVDNGKKTNEESLVHTLIYEQKQLTQN